MAAQISALILLQAGQCQQWDRAEQLIKEGADANATVAEGLNKGANILWWAAFHGKWDIVAQLIKAGANVNGAPAEGPKKGATALWWAALHKKWDIVAQLIEADADVKATAAEGEHKGINILWLVACHGQWDIVAQLIEADADVKATAAEGLHKGATALWWAAFHKKWDIAGQLIKKGADVNAALVEGPNEGVNILWSAASHGQWDIVAQVIKKGANINATSAEGLHKGTTALWWAAFYGQWDIIAQLIEADANVNVAAAEGPDKDTTALWWAACRGKWDIAKQLIKEGADVNAIATQGQSKGINILWLAAFHGQWNIVAQLTKEGASINAMATGEMYKGTTALWWAAFHGQRDITDQLIKAGANINATATGGIYQGKSAVQLIRASKPLAKISSPKQKQHLALTHDNQWNTRLSSLPIEDSKKKKEQTPAAELGHPAPAHDHQISAPPSSSIEHSQKKKKRTAKKKAVEPIAIKPAEGEVKVSKEDILLDIRKQLTSFSKYSILACNLYSEQEQRIKTLITTLRDTLAQAIIALSHHCANTNKHEKRRERLKEYASDIHIWKNKVGLIMDFLKQYENASTSFNQALFRVGTLPESSTFTLDSPITYKVHQLSALKGLVDRAKAKLETEERYLGLLLDTIQKKIKQDNEGGRKKRYKKPPLTLTAEERLGATFLEFEEPMRCLTAGIADKWVTPVSSSSMTPPLPLPSTSCVVSIIEEPLLQEHTAFSMEESHPDSKEAGDEPLSLEAELPLKPRGKKNRDAAFHKRKEEEERKRQYEEERLRQKAEQALAEQGLASRRAVIPLKKEALWSSVELKQQKEPLLFSTPPLSLTAQRHVELAELREAIVLATNSPMGSSLRTCALLAAIVRVCDLMSDAYKATDEQFCTIAMNIKQGSYLRYASLGAEGDYAAILDIATNWEILVLQHLEKPQKLTEQMLVTQSSHFVNIISLGKSVVMTDDKRLPANFCPTDSHSCIRMAATHLQECQSSPSQNLTRWVNQWCCGVIGKELRALILARKQKNTSAQTVYKEIYALIGNSGIDSILQAGAHARHPIPHTVDDCMATAISHIIKLPTGMKAVSPTWSP